MESAASCVPSVTSDPRLPSEPQYVTARLASTVWPVHARLLITQYAQKTLRVTAVRRPLRHKSNATTVLLLHGVTNYRLLDF